ncbi:MAG TPA: CRTAC1 family protein, partial [Chitinophagaceae bacterium]|nr:CRTAC1 family protein [Chitinophagaceae bacterium]
MFETLTSERTGLAFVNKLTPTAQFNMFHYMYFYNGGGIGAGDFNNDGLIDLFFSANQSGNKLYLNTGNLKFKEVTTTARIPQDNSWSTGVSVVDVNNDGLLDLYVCKVGNYETLKSKNQLLVCGGIGRDGVPFYADKAAEYGVDFSGFSTQAAFLDYDMDGDLDLFLLNHSVHQNGSFAERGKFLGTYHPLSGDRLYRNERTHFTDVTKESGINSSAISYGLGIAVSDLNLDGYPDLYIGNDFHENDYFYINQKNGTFNDELPDHIMHTSQFSMGVDVADVTNDGYPEIISMDMLPSDPYILKRSLGEDEFNIFNLKIGYGYNYQYTRNNLQWNRRNGLFSEVGLLAGVAATDWSWAPLWMDFDNDGRKDLFISNGIPKRLNDIDYINYVSNGEMQEKIRDNKLAESDMALIDKFPQIKLPNRFFRNGSDLAFQDMDTAIANNKPTFSNGAVYADLDNDGDLDVVVNNIDDPVLVYENKTAAKGDSSFLELNLKGPEQNRNAVGAKVILFSKAGIQTYEKYPVRGFQSSMEVPLHIGLGGVTIDSLFLVWPDNTFQKLTHQHGLVTLTYQKGLPLFNYAHITTHGPMPTKEM